MINNLNRHNTVSTYQLVALLGSTVIKNTHFTVTGLNLDQQTKHFASKWKREP